MRLARAILPAPHQAVLYCETIHSADIPSCAVTDIDKPLKAPEFKDPVLFTIPAP